MIANENELAVAFRHLRGYEDVLEGLRKELSQSNPALFPVVSESYLQRIRRLQDDIFAYLREHPADAPFKVRLAGPVSRDGVLNVSIVTRVLDGLQKALFEEGRLLSAGVQDPAFLLVNRGSLRSLLGLNLVATKTGSFILALDLAPRQLTLFPELDIAERALLTLIDHVTELAAPREAFSGDRSVLRHLDKLSQIIQPDKLSSIELEYRHEQQTVAASITNEVRKKIDSLLGRPREGEATVEGVLISINIERNVCSLRFGEAKKVDCNYDDAIEDELILAVKKRVVVSGQSERSSDPKAPIRITRLERIRIIEDGDEETEDGEDDG